MTQNAGKAIPFTDLSILSGGQQQQLLTDGYLCIELLSERETLHLNNTYSNNKHENRARPFHASMHQSDFAGKQAIDMGIREVLQKPLKKHVPNYDIVFSNFVVKESGNGSEVDIHADWSYLDESLHASYNVWCTLTNVNEVNGCIWVWPGSHKFTNSVRFTPHVPFGPEDKTMIKSNSIPIPLSAGMGIIYHSGLLHFSEENHSGSSRVATASVLIPSATTPVHYYKPNLDEALIETFEVNTLFFLTHVPDSRPVNCVLKRSIMIDDYKLIVN